MSPKLLRRSDMKSVKLVQQNISPSTKTKVGKPNKKPFDEIYNSFPQVKQHFLIERKIGSGTFSNVYLAKIKGSHEDSKHYVLKHILSTSHPERIENEIKCLREIGGKENVVEIKSCLRYKGEVVIIMPYMKRTKFYKLVNEMGINNVREYMKSLLIALQHVHSFNIIHRDVKPNNFLFNHNTNTGILVDFGLAQKINPKKLATKVEEMSLLKTSVSQRFSCKSVGKPEGNKPVIVGRRCASLGSPKAKRRCLVEIQPNNLQVNQNIAKRFKKKSFQLKNDCDKEPYHLSQKFSLLSTNFQQVKQLTQRKCTVADLIPSIKKNCLKKKHCSIVADNNDCNCFGNMIICHKCLARPIANAPRAGTAGFRPPEVLLRQKEQTTAVDIWAAGIIFLSLLSGRCPFIQPADDMASLAQLLLIFGSEKMEEISKICGKTISTDSFFKKCDLKALIMMLRPEKRTMYPSSQKPYEHGSYPKNQHNKSFSSDRQSEPQAMETDAKLMGFSASDIPQSAYELLFGLLEPNPKLRLTAKQALQNNFFKI